MRIAVFLLAIAGLSPFLSSAQKPVRTVQPADIFSVRGVWGPVVSPEAKWIAYTVRSLDSLKDRSNTDLWMVSFDGTQQIQLTSSPEGESNPQWSPDGKYISFLAARQGGETQVWLLDRRGGEGIQLTRVKDGVDDYTWSPDGKMLVLSVKDGPDTTAKKKPYIINRYKFKQDVQGYKYDTRNTHLYLFDVAAKKMDTLTSGLYTENGPVFSPDGRSIAFVSNRTTDPDRNSNADIWIMDVKKNAPMRQLTTWPGGDSDPKWSPDGKSIAYLRSSSDANAEFYQQQVLCLVSSGGGEPMLLSKDLDRPINSHCWSKDGKGIGVLVQDDTRTYAGVYDAVKGTLKELSGGDRSFAELEAVSANNWITVSSTYSLPAELFALRAGKLERLTRHQQAWADSMTFAVAEKYVSTSQDGTKVSGVIYYPPGKDRRNLPLMMNIHGGPVAQNDFGFDMGSQVMAAHGYAVATVNYRGSSGRGLEYSHTITGDWGNKEVMDILGANDYLVKAGIADSARMGIYGWSYGGILTDYTIASTTRFKVASSGAGMGAPLSLYGVDQYILQYDNEIGMPWQPGNIDKYIKMSYPLLHADRIKTPTQFMGGEKDFNVPISGSEQMYQALRSLNVPSELLVYPNQYHGFSQPSFIKDRYERYFTWFDRYLMK